MALGAPSYRYVTTNNRIAAEINGLVGHKFNLGSPKQLGELLFDRLKLPGGKKTKSGQWETRANHRKRMYGYVHD